MWMHEVLKGTLRKVSRFDARIGHGYRAYDVLGYWPLQETEGQGAELVVNGGFEDWTAGEPDGWTTSATHEYAQVEVETGVFAAETEKVTDAVSSSFLKQAWSDLVGGKSYFVRFRLRKLTPFDARWDFVNVTDGVKPQELTTIIQEENEWTWVSITFQAIAGKTYALRMGTSSGVPTGETYQVADIALREIHAADLSGNDNHGVLRGADNATGPIIGVEGPNDQYPFAYEFDGVDDRIDAPMVVVLGTRFTICGWVRRKALTGSAQLFHSTVGSMSSARPSFEFGSSGVSLSGGYRSAGVNAFIHHNGVVSGE